MEEMLKIEQLLKQNSFMEKTYTGNIFVPLIENILGSFAAGSLPLILYFLFFLIFFGILPELTNIVIFLWILLSFLVFSLITSYRFLSDDLKLKLLFFVFKLGLNYNKENKLLLTESIELHQTQPTNSNSTFTTEMVKNTIDLTEPKNVLKLLKWYFEGYKIALRDCEKRGMTRTSWEKAVNTLKSLKLIKIENKETKIDAASFDVAKKIVYNYYSSQLN